MSKLTPAIYSPKGLENQWINVIWNTHDLMCGCNNAIKHLADILKRQGSLPCLPSTSTEEKGVSTEDHAGEDGFDEGDLEHLFSEDFDEETG